MHRHVVKPGKKSLANEFSLVGSSLEASKQFNVNTLTTLKEENQDNKRLKDCKISPKFLKSLKKSSSSSGDTNVNRVKASKLNGTDKKGNANQDECCGRLFEENAEAVRQVFGAHEVECLRGRSQTETEG